MLTKEQVIRLIMVMDETLQDDVVVHDMALSNRYDNIIQCEMFDQTDLEDYHLEKVKIARNTIQFDEELRELLVEGLRSIKFREEAEKMLKELGKDISDREVLPNGMGKVLLFQRKG